MAIIWSINNLVPLTQLKPGELRTVYYENLCTQPEIEVQIRPRAGSRGECSGCGEHCPGYDTLAPRRFHEPALAAAIAPATASFIRDLLLLGLASSEPMASAAAARAGLRDRSETSSPGTLSPRNRAARTSGRLALAMVLARYVGHFVPLGDVSLRLVASKLAERLRDDTNRFREFVGREFADWSV